MAGVAGKHSAAAEIALIDGVHHQNHFACHLLISVVVGVFRPIAAALFDVAKRAVFAERRREKAHCVHEFLDGNAAEHLDVFEVLLGHERLLCGSRLGANARRGTEQAGYRNSERS
jgi:hypothetical protein